MGLIVASYPHYRTVCTALYQSKLRSAVQNTSCMLYSIVEVCDTYITALMPCNALCVSLFWGAVGSRDTVEYSDIIVECELRVYVVYTVVP